MVFELSAPAALEITLQMNDAPLKKLNEVSGVAFDGRAESLHIESRRLTPGSWKRLWRWIRDDVFERDDDAADGGAACIVGDHDVEGVVQHIPKLERIEDLAVDLV